MTAPQNGVASGLAKKTARNDADEDFLVDQEPSAEVTVRHRFQQQHTHRSTCCCHEAAPELESGFFVTRPARRVSFCSAPLSKQRRNE